jgi:hypothetical protein
MDWDDIIAELENAIGLFEEYAKQCPSAFLRATALRQSGKCAGALETKPLAAVLLDASDLALMAAGSIQALDELGNRRDDVQRYLDVAVKWRRLAFAGLGIFTPVPDLEVPAPEAEDLPGA